MFRTGLWAGAALALSTAGTAQAETARRNARPAAGTVDDIVVTAEKSNRSLRDTAGSVAVVTGDDADRLGAYTTNAVLDRIVNLVTLEPGNDAPTVRGIDGTGPAKGANAFFAGTRPRLNYQVDGRTLGFNEAVFQDASLWDIGQIEIHRGAQSTLQGRNAIAGTIAIRTADPTYAWEGRARGLIGNQGERQLSGVISGPVAAGVAAFRLGADWRRTRAYVDFTPYPGIADPERAENLSLRGKLLFEPVPGVRSLLTLSHTDGRAPQSIVLVPPYHDRISQFPPQPVFRSRNGTAIWDTSWALGDIVTLQAFLSATDFRTDRHALAGQGNARIDGREYIAEPFLRLRSADGRFSGFVAAYIFRTHQSERIDLLGGGAFRDRTRTTALFGEGTARLTDALSLVLGARYENEHRLRRGRAGPFVIDFDETYREFLPKATLSWRAADAVTLGVTAGRGYNGGGAGFTFFPPFVGYRFKPEFVWNYEGFVRASLPGGRTTLTGNIFYNDYRGLQLPFTIAVNSTVIRNAGKATTYGAEAGIRHRPSPGNEIFANAGLLKTNVDRYADPLIQGNALPRSPAFTGIAGFVLSPDGRFEMGADIRYTDAFHSDAFNAPRGRISPYAVVGARIAYPVGRARLSLAVRNLLDNGKPIAIAPGATAATTYATILQPRTVTAGLEAGF